MAKRHRIVVGISFAILGGACASSGTSGPPRDDAPGGASLSSGGGCELLPRDSIYAAFGPVYRDCAVRRKARLLNPELRADFKPTREGCYSADFEYLVDAGGRVTPGTVRMLKSTDVTLADAVLSILPLRRYEPALRDSVPVAQIVTDRVEMTVKRVVAPVGTRPNPGRAGPGC